MGRFHRHDGEEAHAHEHSHEHSHEHAHAHSHEHSHEHAHVHEHSHEHSHPHSHPHAHEHPHHHGPARPQQVHIHLDGANAEIHLHLGGGHAEVHHHPHPHDHHTHQRTPEEIGDHHGYDTGAERIEILERIFDENDLKAAANRAAFDRAGLKCVNLMSSPGAGKTTLLAATLKALQGKKRIGVIEGDIETSLDADRLEGFGAQISLLNTGNGFGGECHLDAPMVARALEGLRLEELDLVLVENVGNLVCPAEFEVGAHASAMVFSVTEGIDKPVKYPVMFRSVDVVVLNKVDLLPYVDFDEAKFMEYLRSVNPTARVIRTTASRAEGLEEWLEWLCS